MNRTLSNFTCRICLFLLFVSSFSTFVEASSLFGRKVDLKGEIIFDGTGSDNKKPEKCNNCKITITCVNNPDFKVNTLLDNKDGSFTISALPKGDYKVEIKLDKRYTFKEKEIHILVRDELTTVKDENGTYDIVNKNGEGFIIIRMIRVESNGAGSLSPSEVKYLVSPEINSGGLDN